MINIGDKLQPTEKARINYGFDKLDVKLPIVAVNVFERDGTQYVQFLAPHTYGRSDELILRTWNARNLEAYQPKPRVKLVPVNTLKIGDKVWSLRHGYWHDIGVLGATVAQKPEALWEGSKYVWKQTSLQADAGAESGRGLFDIVPLSSGHPDNISGAECDPRLDEGAGGADAVPREGDSGTADPVQSPAQPRATVRMTKGRDIKPGERISCVVACDQARLVNYFHAGPFGAPVLIEPDIYYMVVN